MSKKREINNYNDFAVDFRELKSLLKGWKLTSDSSTTLFVDVADLENIEAKLSVPGDPHNWRVPPTTIVFREIDLGNKLRPKRINNPSKIVEKKLKMTSSSKGICYDRSTICNPLAIMSLNIVVEVDYKKDGQIKRSKSAWHLDKHSDTVAEGDDIGQGAETDFLHPEYHFHFGGKNLLQDDQFDLSGNLLLLGSPRIQFFPLDIILAIDFVIQNFYSMDKKAEIVKSSKYNRIVRRAKERLWRPYIYAMAHDLKLINEGARFNDLDLDNDFCKTIYGEA